MRKTRSDALKSKRTRQAPRPRGSGGELLDNTVWTIALLTLFLVPVIVTSSTYDSYRLPKEMFVRAAGIVMTALSFIRWILYGPSPRWRPDHRWSFAGIVVLWTAITAITAQNRTLAGESVLWVAACAVLFIVLDSGVAGRWWQLFYAVSF